MEKYSDNCGALNLGSNRSYSLNDNCGTIRVGSGCTINCKDNSGKIVLGSGSQVLNCNDNSGSITIGDDSTIEKINDNAGRINIGDRCIIQQVKDNCGQISFGANCKVPSGFPDNCGRITMGSGTSSSTNVQARTNTGNVAAPRTGYVHAPTASSYTYTVPAPRTRNERVNAPTAPPMDKVVPAATGEGESSGNGLTCSICIERKRDMAFSCGHTACQQCAQSLNVCHMCRAPVTQRIRLYE